MIFWRPRPKKGPKRIVKFVLSHDTEEKASDFEIGVFGILRHRKN